MTGLDIEQTPADAGFTMPAEWSFHEATWLAWPRRKDDWPNKFECMRWVFAELVRRLAMCEAVEILVSSAAERAEADKTLADAGIATDRVHFHDVRTDRSWIRDNGPVFLNRPHPEPSIAIARFSFNCWARFPDWKLDQAVPARIADILGVPRFDVVTTGKGVVLEGGSIDVNGRGTLITTEECLVSGGPYARNPELTREDLEAALADHLGGRNILWLKYGLAEDDTRGHVDNVCRFVRPNLVVACRSNDRRDANYRRLEENWERLQGMRLEDHSPLQQIALPLPDPVFFHGARLPASYANFYIANDFVLVPTFNDPKDRTALGVLADIFPDRTIVGIHSLDLLLGGGTIHCSTQQQPAADKHPAG